MSWNNIIYDNDMPKNLYVIYFINLSIEKIISSASIGRDSNADFDLISNIQEISPKILLKANTKHEKYGGLNT